MKSLLVTFVFAAVAMIASAQLVNSGFETGDFTGWTTSGDGAHVYTTKDAAITAIPSFDGFYAAILPGSSIVQTTGIPLRAGQTISVWMNASEVSAGSLDLIPNDGPMLSVPWTPHFPPGSNYPSRWNQISFTIQQDGIYSIGASNPADVQGSFSYLGVDVFRISPVPESSAYGVLAAFLILVTIVRHRRKNSAAAS